MRDRKVLRLAFHTAWALEPRVFRQLVRIVSRHAAGEQPTAQDLATVRAAVGSRDAAPAAELAMVGSTAIVPIHGVVSPHGDLVDEVSGPGSANLARIRQQIEAALADRAVKSIVLDIDSPGGSVDGVSEAAELIRRAKAIKPVIALANTNALSAGYWLAAQATQFLATNGARIGSIGVSMTAVDESRALSQQGVDVKIVTSNALKNADVAQNAISTDELRAVADDVQAYHDLFVRDIAAGRGITEAEAAALATGAVLVGQQAVDQGFVDGVSTLDAVLASLNNDAEAAMSKPQTPTGGAAAGGKSGGKKAGRQRAEGDTVVNVTVPAAPTSEDPPMDDEEEDEEEGEEKGEGENAEAPKPEPAKAESSTSAREQGIREERERVRAIQAMCKPGLEPVIAALIESGVSANDAARSLEAADKSFRAGRMNALRGAEPVEQEETVTTTREDAVQSALTPEARAEWKKDARLRANFNNDEASFAAYKAAEKAGRVPALNGRK